MGLFREIDAGCPLSANPFDSSSILIRLHAIPNLTKSAQETPLVRRPKTPSSAHAKRVPRHVA
ncbi:hypothetical protein XH86_03110 [Bradyrhizobium guangdongense]|uniref:Uncharacterized protein n=1 Tax=Bradyrhizobium guangdongense TaxID=1325090 RepID=A0ABX6U959_9BRAD|nr:hypothetical protein X265_03110 [Bradyrhizobium guangdongense]QOZ57850.1 hypothetical protein XH86_03110 [Bradyrhizobium guangdongense]